MIAIRRRTSAELCDLVEERIKEAYDAEYARVLDAQRAEWEAEFGKDNPRFPFEPDGTAIHNTAVANMKGGM